MEKLINKNNFSLLETYSRQKSWNSILKLLDKVTKDSFLLNMMISNDIINCVLSRLGILKKSINLLDWQVETTYTSDSDRQKSC